MTKHARDQNLPALRERLKTVLEVEIPSFARRMRPPPFPILDSTPTIDEFGSQEDHSAILSDETIINTSHVVGLRKFKGDLVHELKVLEKVPVDILL